MMKIVNKLILLDTAMDENAVRKRLQQQGGGGCFRNLTRGLFSPSRRIAWARVLWGLRVHLCSGLRMRGEQWPDNKTCRRIHEAIVSFFELLALQFLARCKTLPVRNRQVKTGGHTCSC